MASTEPTTQLLTRATLRKEAKRYIKSQKASNKKFMSELKRRISDKILSALGKSGPKDMKLYIYFPTERKEIEKTGIMFEGDSKLCIEKMDELVTEYCEAELKLSLENSTTGEGVTITFRAGDSILSSSSSSSMAEPDKSKLVKTSRSRSDSTSSD